MNESGIYQDSVNINGKEPLYRLIPLNPTIITYDCNLKRLRPSSGLFVNSKPDQLNDLVVDGKTEQYLSVHIQSILRDIPLKDEEVIEQDEKFGGITCLPASVYREPGDPRPKQRVFPEPLDPPPARQPAHGGVAGQKSQSVRQQFAEMSSWIIGPPVGWLERHRQQLKIPVEIDISESYQALLGRSS